MNETRDNDQQFEALFNGFAPPLADDGFTDAVMGRVTRRRWVRHLVLAVAGTVGGLIAVAPFAQLTNRLAEILVTLATHWNDVAWLGANQVILVGVLLITAIPAAVRLLEK